MRSRNASQPSVRWRQVLACPRAPMSSDHPQQPERERGVGARAAARGARRACSAVRVRSGSIATMWAPPSCAAEHVLPGVVAAGQRVGAPQQDQLGVHERLRVHARRRCRSCTRRPRAPPPSRPSSCGARRPSTFHSRRPAWPSSPWMNPSVPVPWNGQIASPPCSAITACSRSAISSSASSQEIRSKRPSPLAPDPPQRVQQPVRRPGVLEVAVDLGAQRAVGERVLAVAAQAHRLPVLHGDHPASRCPGSRAGRRRSLPPLRG